ncbi:MAG: metal-dependent phosphohydrolase [Gammaproteobacteria bacterium]|nr:metal-dependent phosphohydrolase [Gammaproteobacteria bacterium]
MLDVTKTLISEFQKTVTGAYRSLFDDQDPEYLALVEQAAETALSNIATSNASYHNVEHTIYVTATGISILEGKHMETPLSSKRWTETVLSLLFHDIGFVRGLCNKDIHGYHYTGIGEETLEIQRGKTDASMMPFHVDRGQCFVIENYAGYDNLDIEFIQQCIERTRFPIPDAPEYQSIDDMPGLVRAADLIGQFSDPRYINKLNALFQEFDEQGINARIGYENLQDMREGYPAFFETQVQPFIKEGVRLLELTDVGKEIIASMQNNLEVARRRFPAA